MSGQQILVIEDERPFRKIMEAALTKQGYNVATAEDGSEGETKIRELKPDLVIMDVMMPGKNGLDICIEMKKDPDLQAIPVLMMTCLTENSDRDDDYWREQTGADDFITKPFPLGEFLRRIREIFGREQVPCG